MACHLAHKLPWASLYEIALRRPARDAEGYTKWDSPSEDEQKKIGHFARCLVKAIDEFRDSDRSSDEERAAYDPTTWDVPEYGHGGHMGYHYSIPAGYVLLNLILMDPEKMVPRFVVNAFKASCTLQVLAGLSDGAHPEHLADHLKLAFDGYDLKLPVTAETAQVLRDHAAKMFRCMYSTSGNHHWGDVESLAGTFEGCFM